MLTSGGASGYLPSSGAGGPSTRLPGSTTLGGGENSSRFSPRTWPQIGGRISWKDIIRSLQGSRSGVLITGASGSGKSYLTSRVVNEIRDDSFIVMLRASAGLKGTPYGALNMLLRELDPHYLAHPALVLSALTTLLTERAQGKPAFLVIENAGEVDELAGVVISQLARDGTVGLILTCSDPRRLCTEITRLYSNGFLERIELQPLSLPDALTWLQAGLGARVSAAVAYELWTASGGNPHYLKMLAAELVDYGSLSVRDGIWVLTGNGKPHGPAITDLIVSRLGKLGKGERKVLEIVSLVGTVPLEALLSVAAADDVDSLERRDILVVDHSLPRMVSLQNQLLCNVIRAGIPTGRSRDLRQQFCQAVDSSLMHPALIVALAAWALECGSTLSREETLRAAAIANTRADPLLALRLIRSVPGYPSGAAAVAEESSALVAIGAVHEARKLLGQHRGKALGLLSPAESVRFELAEVDVLQADPETMDIAVERLQYIRKLLYGSALGGHRSGTVLHDGDVQSVAPVGNNVDEVRLRELLVLAEARAASHSGRYSEVIAHLERALQDFETHGPEFRLLAGSWLCEAWALTGRQTEASDIAEQLLAEGRNQAIPAAAAWSAAGRLRCALLLAGRWEAAALIPPPNRNSALPAGQPFPASYDLSLAVLRCLQGRAHEGLETLVPLIEQLRVRDDEGLLEVAYAAAAYGSAIQGDQERARHYLVITGLRPFCPGRPWEWIRSYCCTLASAHNDKPRAVIDELLRLADADHEAGALGLELFALSMAVRLGAATAAPRLLEAALKCEGDFAGLCAAYARAVLSGDIGQQVAASQLAQDLHHDRFAFDIAEAVLRSDGAQQDRRLFRQSRQLVEICRQRMGAPQEGGQQGSRITARELEIAKLAATGNSNKAIAARLHVSVRTVEGHLYQIYGKLQIVERSELPFALGVNQDGRE